MDRIFFIGGFFLSSAHCLLFPLFFCQNPGSFHPSLFTHLVATKLAIFPCFQADLTVSILSTKVRGIVASFDRSPEESSAGRTHLPAIVAVLTCLLLAHQSRVVLFTHNTNRRDHLLHCTRNLMKHLMLHYCRAMVKLGDFCRKIYVCITRVS